MLTQAINNQNAVLAVALHGTQVRNDTIMNNIANVDTPGFTARRVEFEAELGRAIDNWKANGMLDLSRVRPSVLFQELGFRFRMDGSNVDIEREMVALYINSIRYDALANAVMHNSRMLSAVLQGR